MTLAEYIASNLAKAFEWGAFDCCHFAAGWVMHSTGRDPLADLPRWKSERGARRVMRIVGGLEAALDARFERINPNFAKDGDLALCDGAVCIYSGAHVVGPHRDGLKFVDRMRAQAAWTLEG